MQESNVEMIQYNSEVGVWGTAIMCVLITIIIIYCYLSKRISASSAIIYSWSTQTYGLLFIGPTFNSFLFVQYFLILTFGVKQITTIPKTYLRILIFPFFSSFFIFFYTKFYDDFFFYHDRSKVWFYLRPFYYYIKVFIPLFMTGFVVVKDKKSTINDFFTAIKFIALISCVIGIVQFIVSHSINNIDIDELIGLKRRYINAYGSEEGIMSVRIQALMAEPKTLGSFFCLAIPILLRNKNYILMLICLILSILTQSQSFAVLFIIYCITFLLSNNVKHSVRYYITVPVILILGLFQIVSFSKNYIIENYEDFKDYEIIQLISKRAIDRYVNNIDSLDEIEFAGMPLQREAEMPVIKFFSDYPFLWITGIGLGNNMFINPNYYEGTSAYKDRLGGAGAPTITMRWFNYIIDFGLLICIYIFTKMTKINNRSPFIKKYYAFLWVCLFFAMIDIWVVVFYGLLLKEKNEDS